MIPSAGTGANMNRPIEDVMKEARAWADLKGVGAVGQGTRNGQSCIEVKVSADDAARRIPGTLRGYRVCVEFTGPIQAQKRRRG
jgi:hypothetical protein